MTQRAVGIDFGARQVKCVVLSRSDGLITVESVKSVPLTTGMISDGVVVDRKAVASCLRHAVTGKLRTAISVPTQHATLKWMTLPQLPLKEHRRAAAAKVESHLQYRIEDAYLITSPSESGESLVISVPKQVITSRALAVERAGLRPVCAELEGQALLRLLERSLRRKSPLLRDASITIIDIGGANTVMYVMQNRKLQFIRSVRFGISRIAAHLARELEVTEVQAHAMLANPGATIEGGAVLCLPSPTQTIRIEIGNDLDVLLKEIARLMRYFRSLHAERSYAGILDHMMLCGGLANVAGLSEYLAQELRVRIAPLEPFGGMTFNVDDPAFRLASQSPNSFAIAVGLALSQFGEFHGVEEVQSHDDFVWSRSA